MLLLKMSYKDNTCNHSHHPPKYYSHPVLFASGLSKDFLNKAHKTDNDIIKGNESVAKS